MPEDESGDKSGEPDGEAERNGPDPRCIDRIPAMRGYPAGNLNERMADDFEDVTKEIAHFRTV